MRNKRRAAALAAAVLVSAAGVAHAGPKPPATSVTWNGRGTTVVGSDRSVTTEICGTSNGAPADGRYFVFVLASTKTISNPTIVFGNDTAVAMTRSSSGSKGTSSYKALYTGSLNAADLLSAGVFATYSSSAAPTLTLSHGCSGATGPTLTVYNGGSVDYSVSPPVLRTLIVSTKVCEVDTSTDPLTQLTCVTFTPSDARGSSKLLPVTTNSSSVVLAAWTLGDGPPNGVMAFGAEPTASDITGNTALAYGIPCTPEASSGGFMRNPSTDVLWIANYSAC